MKTFFTNVTVCFILLFTASLSASGQTCKVTITGNCVGDSLFAHFNGDNLTSLICLWSDNSTPDLPIFNSSIQTVAGGNGNGFGANQLVYPKGIYVDKPYRYFYSF